MIKNGNFTGAVIKFDFVLQQEPHSLPALRGLVFCHAKLMHWKECITANMNLLQLGKHQQADLAMLLNVLESCQLNSYVPMIEHALKIAMQHVSLERPSTELLTIQFKAKYSSIFSESPEIFTSDLNKMIQDNTLHRLIERSCIADHTLEKLLLLARQELLLRAENKQNIQHYHHFLAALSCQMLLNDGLYHTSEQARLMLDKIIATDKLSLTTLLLRFCYENFAHVMILWQQNNHLLQDNGFAQLERDLAFYAQVMDNTDTGNIINLTSKKVQSFYMHNPYPKWKVAQTGSISIAQIFTQVGKTLPDKSSLLIAGCGTGNQVIEWALNNPDITISAIDLSPTSLNYAKLMAASYKITNVDFQVLDILDVASLGRSFDFIISTGVLHHMAIPQQGLNALSEVLNPGGMMYLALYSKMARKELSLIKDQAMAWLNIDEKTMTSDDICHWRANLNSKDVQRPWFQVRDFFYLNGIKDLLFHPQQTEYNPLELQDMIETAGLTFDWMIVTPLDKRHYAKAFTLDPIPRGNETLQYWQDFELKHPPFFNGQFKFFVSKPSKN
jgi:2-polyprenyl-3-methyl-5-hydroxy-6-metoxy-1,4-benzoquinol methylase